MEFFFDKDVTMDSLELSILVEPLTVVTPTGFNEKDASSWDDSYSRDSDEEESMLLHELLCPSWGWGVLLKMKNARDLSNQVLLIPDDEDLQSCNLPYSILNDSMSDSELEASPIIWREKPWCADSLDHEVQQRVSEYQKQFWTM